MCDTFVALPSATSDGSVIFGKNSDREPNEAQVIEYHPAMVYPQGTSLRCTYLQIPQARETHAVLLSRPFWMWGAEMGANAHGVVIGNEAVWTRMPVNKKPGLTGMDLLRLALERAKDAENAMQTIIQLISDYGQGGICGYEDKNMAYHNSFIIADPEMAWIFETTGNLWAAKKVNNYYSISNSITIGTEIDSQHPELIHYAKKNGWLKKGKEFNFSECYSDWFYTTFSASRQRRNDSFCALRDKAGKIDVDHAFKTLRKHPHEPYRPDNHLLGNSICAHAGFPLTRLATQSTGSMVAHMKKGLNTFWITGTSSPCTGIFKPAWFGEKVLPDMGPVPDGSFNGDSLWWKHELLHRQVIRNYSHRINLYREERDDLEKIFRLNAENHPGFDTTREAFEESAKRTSEWTKRAGNEKIKKSSGFMYRNFWGKMNAKSGIPN